MTTGTELGDKLPAFLEAADLQLRTSAVFCNSTASCTLEIGLKFSVGSWLPNLAASHDIGDAQFFHSKSQGNERCLPAAILSQPSRARAPHL
jgi:hypothetical protein